MFKILFFAFAFISSFGSLRPAFALYMNEDVAAINPEKFLKSELTRIRNHLDESEEKFILFTQGNADCKKEFQKFSKTLFQAYCKGQGLIEKDVHDIIEALTYAADRHQNGIRKGANAPYIIHPLGVAEQLIAIGQVYDRDTIIAALLHDTVEKADVTFEELEALFGARITGFVREVTDDYSLPKMERRRLQVANAPGKTANAAQIDLSDKLYDISEFAKNSAKKGDKKGLRKVLWIKDVVDNLPWVNVSLKNACDKVINTLIKQMQT